MSLLSVHCDANTRRWMTENEARGFKGTLVMMHIGNGQCGPECHGITDKNPSTTTPPPGSCPRFREQGVWAASAARGRIMVPIQEVVAGAQLAFTGKPTPSPIDNRPSTIDNRQSLSKSETRKYGNHVSLMSGYSPCYTGARPPHVSHHAETRRFRTDNPW
ncbi:hypothetical protein E4U54_007566 [Claviceps lovelessii]|nr:hypothetical protein E4U54_007566 [Claviceps lovelessii]